MIEKSFLISSLGGLTGHLPLLTSFLPCCGAAFPFPTSLFMFLSSFIGLFVFLCWLPFYVSLKVCFLSLFLPLSFLSILSSFSSHIFPPCVYFHSQAHTFFFTLVFLTKSSLRWYLFSIKGKSFLREALVPTTKIICSPLCTNNHFRYKKRKIYPGMWVRFHEYENSVYHYSF